MDRFIQNSETLTDVKNTFFNGNPEYFRDKVNELVDQFNLSTDDVKDLSIAALIARLTGLAGSDEARSELHNLLRLAQGAGVAENRVSTLNIGSKENA